MSIEPHNEEILHGESLFLSERLDEALQVFDHVLQADPGNPTALNDKGVVLNRLGRFDEAFGVFSEIVGRNPGLPNAAYNLVSNCLSLHGWEEAEKMLSDYREQLSEEELEILAAQILELKYRASPCSPHLLHVPLTVNVLSRGHELRLFLDTRQYTQKNLWDHLSQNQVYEGETLDFLCGALKPGDGFIDIGAHIGYFSLIVSRIVGEEGRVLAVEPDPANGAHLSKHLSINGVSNVRLFRAVAGAEKGEAEFFFNSDNDGGHALWDAGLHPFNRKSREKPIRRTVSMITLDELIRLSERAVRAVKIDTEGAEMQVLRGGAACLREFDIPHVICEINGFGLARMGNSEEELRDLMTGLGYDTYFMQERKPRLTRLQPGQYVNPPHVFNLLFSRDRTLREPSA